MALLKLGVSGVMGSFSEQAGELYLKNKAIEAEIVYLVDMDRVLAAVDSGAVDLGIFPVVNLHGGLVKMAIEAMGRYPYVLVDDLWLEVEQCLLVHPAATRDQIKTIASHSQALAQCRDYLSAQFPMAKQLDWEDTAKAAQDLSEGILDKTCAVIAPAKAAALYHLQILASNIQDTKPNLTSFIIVKQRK